MTLDPNSGTTHHEARNQCHRQRHKHYGLVGPVVLMTIGMIFLVSEFFPDWGVGRTWPVVLIAIGLAKLAEAVLAQKSAPPDQRPERLP